MTATDAAVSLLLPLHYIIEISCKKKKHAEKH